MNTTQHKKSSIVLVVCALIVLLSFILVFIFADLPLDPPCQSSIMDTHWYVKAGDEIYEDATLSTLKFTTLKKGQYVISETILPDDTIPDPVMRVFSDHCSIQVLIDGVEIYNYGVERVNNNKFVGYGFHYVRMPYDYAGHKLTIISRASENMKTRTLQAPIIYDSMTMTREFLMDNRWLLASNMFMLVSGIGLFFLSVISVIKRKAGFRLAAIGAFSCCIATWSLCIYNLVGVFTTNILMKNYLEYYSLYLTPVFFLAYFWSDLRNRDSARIRNTYMALFSTQCLFVVFASVAHCFNWLHLSVSVWGQLFLIGLDAIGILVICVHDAFANTYHSKIVLMGVGAVTFLTIVDLGLFAIKKFGIETNFSRFTSVTSLGAVIFVVCLVGDLYVENESKMVEVYKVEALQQMAYEDPLTGIPNRRRYEDVLLKCQESSKDYAIIVMDVNDLKKKNDIYGHEQGDFLIKSMAECLGKAFGSGLFYARTGGDEFAAIISDPDRWDPESLLWRLQAEIDIKNEETPGLNLSVAGGFCRSTEFPGKSSREIYREADNRMYERKIQMKTED